MEKHAHHPLSPVIGRPLLTVHQLNTAIRGSALVFAECSNGVVQQVEWSRQPQGVFQVRLARTQEWVAHPARVWAIKKTDRPEQSTQPTAERTISIERTPVNAQTLEDLQVQLFLTPLWLETPVGGWLIIPQITRNRLVLRRWRDQSSSLSAASLRDLVAQIRSSAVLPPDLLSADELAPFHLWQRAKFVELMADISSSQPV